MELPYPQYSGNDVRNQRVDLPPAVSICRTAHALRNHAVEQGIFQPQNHVYHRLDDCRMLRFRILGQIRRQLYDIGSMGSMERGNPAVFPE